MPSHKALLSSAGPVVLEGQERMILGMVLNTMSLFPHPPPPPPITQPTLDSLSSWSQEPRRLQHSSLQLHMHWSVTGMYSPAYIHLPSTSLPAQPNKGTSAAEPALIGPTLCILSNLASMRSIKTITSAKQLSCRILTEDRLYVCCMRTNQRSSTLPLCFTTQNIQKTEPLPCMACSTVMAWGSRNVVHAHSPLTLI